MHNLKGKIKEIFDIQTFPSGFTKREFVLTSEENYPQDIKIECIKERCDLLADLNVNDEVHVQFNIRGNEYKDRYYVNLQAWKIEKLTESPAEDTPDPEDTTDYSSEPEDDVPF